MTKRDHGGVREKKKKGGTIYTTKRLETHADGEKARKRLSQLSMGCKSGLDT